jgi:hypothetical protein
VRDAAGLAHTERGALGPACARPRVREARGARYARSARRYALTFRCTVTVDAPAIAVTVMSWLPWSA